jgi:hypothetical protein
MRMKSAAEENRQITVVAGATLGPMFMTVLGFILGPVLIPPGTDLSGPLGLRQALTGAAAGLLVGIVFALVIGYLFHIRAKGLIAEEEPHHH